jgi:hypothetical protein
MTTEISQPSSIRPQLTILILLLGVIAALQAWETVTATFAPATRWEYTIDAPADEDLAAGLQKIGAAGWELVSARRATGEAGGKTRASYEMIFKRPLGAGSSTPVLPSPPK